MTLTAESEEKQLERKLGLATRDAYGQVLVELGKENPNVVVLDGDLAASTKTKAFSKQFPDRFFNVGIAEANLVGLAGGLAHSGKIPFISSFSCFLVCKGYDQLRMAVAVPHLNVKVITSHGGISVGEDGISQQSIEDVALMTSLPGFTVAIPADEHSARVLVRQAAQINGPVYLRTGRPKAPLIYTEDSKWPLAKGMALGKGTTLRSGKEVTLVANGLLVFEALVAAEQLEKMGISAAVIDMHTVKPLDEELLKTAAVSTGAVVTAEEHSIWGGLGSAVAGALARWVPVPMESVAIQDTYAESGKPDELFKKYGLTAENIVAAAQRVIKRKRP